MSTHNFSRATTPGSESRETRSQAEASGDERTPGRESNGPPDLEKANTQQDAAFGVSTTSGRITRIQSLTRRKTRDGQFSHALAHVKTSQDVIVDFEGLDDPYHPLNWPIRKKVITTLLYGLTTMGATFASSVYSPDIDVISQDYGVGTEVSLLGLSLLLAGFGLGPLCW